MSVFHLTSTLPMTQTELITLILKLIVFGIVCEANARWIISFNRWCQYEPDQGVKMILWKVKVWSDKYLGDYLSKPVYSCPTCMASLHGIIPFIFTYVIICGWNLLMIPVGLFYLGSLSERATYKNEH